MILQASTPTDALKALAALQNNPAFQRVLAYLKEELAVSDKKLRLANDAHVIGKYQGCSLTLSDFIEKAQQASDRLKSMESV